MASTAQRIAGARSRASRRKLALAQYLGGADVGEIAAGLKTTDARAAKLLAKALSGVSVQPAGQFAKIHILRLEALYGVLADKIAQGESAASETYLRMLGRAERLYGLLQRSALETQADDDEARVLARKFDRLVMMASPPPEPAPSAPSEQIGGECAQ